jgi:23S rRNA (cytosine1962-C5)-methyltransferase
MATLATEPRLMIGEGWKDYALLDSGNGRKWERFGRFSFVRPEPQALWSSRIADWDPDGEFVPGPDADGGGGWHHYREIPQGWPIERGGILLEASCTPFRHLAFFPEMAPVWDWMGQMLEGRTDAEALNLFAYTGAATCALSEYGRVTHVDASKKAVAQARLNASLAGKEERPVRWLIEDASAFAAREARRGRRYDGIILDPPKYGRGPKKEVWRLEEDLSPLLASCRRLLDEGSRFLFLTVYAIRMSSLAIANALAEALSDLPGRVEHGDLVMREAPAGSGDRRLLPAAIFARWSNTGGGPV